MRRLANCGPAGRAQGMHSTALRQPLFSMEEESPNKKWGYVMLIRPALLIGQSGLAKWDLATYREIQQGWMMKV